MALPWGIHTLRQIYSPSVMAGVEDTKYAYAVCEPYTAGRLRAAWWVLTGRAFAFEWPKAGDLEAAIGMPLWDRAAKRPRNPLLEQSRKVRNFSDPSQVFEAVPTSFIGGCSEQAQ